MIKRWSIATLCILLISGGAVANPTKGKGTSNVSKKREDAIIKKEIKSLRKDYQTFLQGVKALSKTTSYMVKRLKRNERVALERKISKETKSSKIQDIIERAKLLRLLEQRLKQYQASPDPLWTPELLWRTAVLYHEIAEEREIWVVREDEASGKILTYDGEYQEILNQAYKLSKGVIRPADTSLGVNYFRRKAEANLKELISDYPTFRAIGSAYHLLARIYEKPPFTEEDIKKSAPAKVSLGAVCSNWGYRPFTNSFKKILVEKGLLKLSATAFKEYNTWDIKEFPTKLPFDVFANCKTVKGSTEFIGTAWATLGKFLSNSEVIIPFKTYDESLLAKEMAASGRGGQNSLSKEEMERELKGKIQQFNLTLTRWASLSAYKRALGAEYKDLTTRGYVVYFAGLMLFQMNLNPALTMKLLDRVVRMGQNEDKNSPHEAAIKYIGFVLQEERLDRTTLKPSYSWPAPYLLKCKDKCPLKKLVTYFKGREHLPHTKRIWLGVARAFHGLENNKLYYRSDEELRFAYALYDYIFRKMDREGGWRYNPDKPDIFWKMSQLIDLITTRTNEDTNLSDEEKQKRIASWRKKKADLYAFALNVVFRSDEVENFLTAHQQFLLQQAKRKIGVASPSLEKLRQAIVDIKSYTLFSTGYALAKKAREIFFQMKNAKGEEKNRLKRRAQEAFGRAIAYYRGIMRDYPNSIYMYRAMVNIMNFYKEDTTLEGEWKGKKSTLSGPHYYLVDIALTPKEKKKAVYEGLKWSRSVRDSHLGTAWRKVAALVINSLYEEKLGLKNPPYPYDVKKESGPQIMYVKRDIPLHLRNYLSDAKTYMKMHPKDANSPIFLYRMARIYLAYGHIDMARKLYRTILEKYCSNYTAFRASQEMFASYEYEKVAPENEKKWLAEKEESIRYLKKQKCGGDEKHRELMARIANVALTKFRKRAEELHKEAMAAKKNGKNSLEKWEKVLAHYEVLRRKMETRTPTKKEEKNYYDDLMQCYWAIYKCKKELEDAPGVVKVLEQIRKNKRLFQEADKWGVKQEIFYELADNYRKSFNDDKALAMWRELTKTGPKGTWRIATAKGKVNLARESSFKLEAEEQIFWIYKSLGKRGLQKTLKQGEKLIARYRTRKPLYKQVTIPDSQEKYKALARALNIKEDTLSKFYRVFWTCKAGSCVARVVDNSMFFKEILFDLYLGKGFEALATESDLYKALARVKDMERAYERYVSLSRMFTPTGQQGETYTTRPEYGPMFQKRLRLLYRRATIYRAIMEKNRRNYARKEKARAKYREVLEEYRKLYEKNRAATPSHQTGYQVMNYGGALISYVWDMYEQVKNPFKGLSTLPITVYEESVIALKDLVLKTRGNKKSIIKKLDELEAKLNKREQEYRKEIYLYLQARKNLGSKYVNKLSEKDYKKYRSYYLKNKNKYKAYHKDYKNIKKALKRKGLPRRQVILTARKMAIENHINRQKDIKQWNEQFKRLDKKGAADSVSSRNDFLKKFLPKWEKAFKTVEKILKGQKLPNAQEIQTLLGEYKKALRAKKALSFKELRKIRTPLKDLAVLSVGIASKDAVSVVLKGAEYLGGEANVYNGYTKLKGYFRKRVATIRADLIALKMHLLYEGIKIFEKAPYPERRYVSMLDKNKSKLYQEAGCSFPGEKENKACFLKYKRKNFHKVLFTSKDSEGKERKEIVVPLDRFLEEYNKAFQQLKLLMTKEKVTSKYIRKAYNNYSRFNKGSGKLAPVVDPIIERVN